MTKTFAASRDSRVADAATPSPFRRAAGALRIAAGLLVFASISTQIVDQLVNDAFIAEEYFSYFTIQSSLMNVVVLIVAGLVALRHANDTRLLTSVRAAIVSYAVVTGAVYNALLRNIPNTGFEGIRWPNDVIHVVIPIYIAVDFLVVPGRARLDWRALWVAVSYPLVWLGFTIVRGLATGWFPYPFLQPGGPGGWGSVIAYILGITAFIVSIAAVAIAVTRYGSRRGAGRGARDRDDGTADASVDAAELSEPAT